MKQGGTTASSVGFTIVEVLIVLAVSGMLLVSALLLINGRQNKTEFMVAINDLRQQVQQTINETTSGYYPNNQDFTCQAGANGPVISAGSAGQGTNQGCVFIGKAIRFSSSTTSLGAGGTQATDTIDVIPLAGLRQVNGQEVTSLDQAKPYALAPGTNGGIDASQTLTTQNGLTYAGKPETQAQYASTFCLTSDAACATPRHDSTVIAIISGFGAYNSAGGQLQSGATQFGLYELPAGHTYSSDKEIVDQINCSGSGRGCPVMAAPFVPIDSASVCYASGGTNQSGLLTIGSTGGGGLTVSLQIFSGDRQCGVSS